MLAPGSILPTTPPPDEVIKADVVVVSNLKELEASFCRMLVQVIRLLVNNKCDLSQARFFLDSLIGSEEFTECENFEKLMRQLQRGHYIDVFNISILQELLASCLNNDKLTKVIRAYLKKKEGFFKQTTVLEFQRAVVSRVKPILANGEVFVTITISEMSTKRTLEDIEKLAIEGFEERYKRFVHLRAEVGSIIISWVFPEGLSDSLEDLVRKNAAVFEDYKVLEVTVGGRRVFPNYTQKEVKINNYYYSTNNNHFCCVGYDVLKRSVSVQLDLY